MTENGANMSSAAKPIKYCNFLRARERPNLGFSLCDVKLPTEEISASGRGAAALPAFTHRKGQVYRAAVRLIVGFAPAAGATSTGAYSQCSRAAWLSYSSSKTGGRQQQYRH